MKVTLIKLAASLILSSVSVAALAEPITISSYDATGVAGHGFYNGTQEWLAPSLLSYSGGSGSLNDGQVTTGNYDAHLFNYKNNGSITLHLSELASISSLQLFSPEFMSNFYLGSIAGLNVTINGETRYIATQGFGPASSFAQRDHIHEFIDLVGTGLENLLTDTITLSGFVADDVKFSGQHYSAGFYLAEIGVDGKPFSAGVVSEPAGLALLIAGFAGLGFIQRRRLKRSLK